MIRVNSPIPPGHYIPKTKIPGEAFLRRHPNPSHKQWHRHDYWREVHGYLYNELKGICMYSASWTPRSSRSGWRDQTSLDHFIPKSKNPSQAYEWANFRLCRSRLNNRKDKHDDVMDPCAITARCFTIDFQTFLIKPAPNLSISVERTVNTTIARFQLNMDNDYVTERITVIKNYSLGQISIQQVERKYPFIAMELKEQNFDVNFRPRIVQYFRLDRSSI